MSLPQEKQHNESDEQELCVLCGLCCDGTLFNNATLVDDDVVYLETHSMDLGIDLTNKRFKHPCRYHIKRSCSVYLQWRPRVCSSFVCKVILRLRSGELVYDQAVSVILKALLHAEEVRKSLEPFVKNGRDSLNAIFKEYTATHPVPDPRVMLDFFAFKHRLKRDFHKKNSPKSS